jgi:hypothetical protein
MSIPNVPQHVRAYVYRVLVAVFAVLALHGVVTTDEVPVYLDVAESVLALSAVSLAARNTPRKVD